MKIEKEIHSKRDTGKQKKNTKSQPEKEGGWNYPNPTKSLNSENNTLKYPLLGHNNERYLCMNEDWIKKKYIYFLKQLKYVNQWLIRRLADLLYKRREDIQKNFKSGNWDVYLEIIIRFCLDLIANLQEL